MAKMRGGIVKRGDGWRYVVYIGKDAAGKKLYRTGTEATRDAAVAARDRLRQELRTGTYIEPTSLTVGTFLARWLAHAKTTVRGSTYTKYQEIVRVYLDPHLAHVPLAKLGPLAIQMTYGKLLATGGRGKLLETGERGTRPLSARTVQQTHAVLHRALAMAVRWNLLAANPADRVDAPTPTKREARALDEAATARLLTAAAGTVWHLPLLLAATTGARRGEVLGLRWRDVDGDAGRVLIQQTLAQTKMGAVLAVPTTKSGKPRPVALPSQAIEALRRHRSEQARAKLASPQPWRDDLDLVLPYPGTPGEPWGPESFTSGFRAWCRRSGFTGLKFHALRHGHASHLLRAGASLKLVSSRLGHSTVAITGDLYAHLLGGEDEQAALALAAAFTKAGLA
jgi:integrase